MPTDKPRGGYNTTAHPVTIDFYIDSACPLSVRVRNSFPRTAAHIAHQFAHWLPAHALCALLLGLKHAITVTPAREPFKCAAPVHSVHTATSFFIITASRVFVKMIEWTQRLPALDEYEHSMVVSVLVHGAAVALVVLALSGLGGVVRLGGKVGKRLLGGTTRWASWLECGGGRTVTVLTVGALVLGIVMMTCGGLALVVACGVYLLVVSRCVMISY